jgi:hypothetical protein
VFPVNDGDLRQSGHKPNDRSSEHQQIKPAISFQFDRLLLGIFSLNSYLFGREIVASRLDSQVLSSPIGIARLLAIDGNMSDDKIDHF